MQGLMGGGPQNKMQTERRGETDPANTAGAQPNVSPEEQQQYEQFVGQALNLIYDDKGMQAVTQRLKGTGDPMDDLAQTAVMVVTRVQESAREAGQDIPGDVLFHGGVEIIEDLANLAEKAGIHSFSEDELEGATYRALDLYRETATQAGLIDPAPLKQEFGELMQADQQGRLGEIIPGIEKYGDR